MIIIILYTCLCSLGCCGTVLLWPEQQLYVPRQEAAGVRSLTVIAEYMSVICICMYEQEYPSVSILGKQRDKLISDTILVKSTDL